MPSSCGQSIEIAVKAINSVGKIDIKTWTGLQIGGRYIIKTILDNIDASDIVFADITGLNNNVLFELGYAIGKRKSVQIIFDNSQVESDRLYKELQLLSTVGFKKYHNSNDIIAAFKDGKSIDSISPLVSDLIDDTLTTNIQAPFLYLKGQIPTNYSQEILSLSDHYNLKPITDDASEERVQPINWYFENLAKVPSVLIEFSSMNRRGHEIQNMKCAFIAGVAIGLGKHVKMVAERPYDEAPIDYRDLLSKFNKVDDCQRIIKSFLNQTKDKLAQSFNSSKETNRLVRIKSEIQKIGFGEFTAEHESEKIYDYYVDISHLDSLIRNEHNIVVGRKGSGKTATLYYLNSYLASQKKNYVVLIKPVNFELDAIVRLLESLKDDFEIGYVIEAVWKFLIYTEIVKNIYTFIRQKPLYAVGNAEQALIEYVENNKNIFLPDFSTRLDEKIESMLAANLNEETKQSLFKVKVSELLHDTILYQIRNLIASVIDKNEKITVLIDNLDKSWNKNANHRLMSRYILGLLGAVGRIHEQIAVIKHRGKNIHFSLVIFLRSDIFRYVVQEAREPDKMEITRLFWDDYKVLFRIVEERFVALSDLTVDAEDLWNRYICEKVVGMSAKNYIQENVYPRPRDVIYFLNRAKDASVSRGHRIIDEDDMRKAYENYSSWVFDSLIAENADLGDQLRSFLYKISGSKVILSKEEIILNMIDANLNTDDSTVNSFINQLVSLSILGREVKPNIFRFEYNMDDDEVSVNMAIKLGSGRFKVHNSLHCYLELVT